jgi:hypothetical protein
VWIDYPIRGQFIDPCRNGIKINRQELDTGKEIKISIKAEKPGFKGKHPCHIYCQENRGFWVENLKSDYDPSRFPQRIKGCAKALYMENCYGRYEISHSNGTITVKKSVWRD